MKNILKVFIAYISLLVVFVALLFLVHRIPTDSLVENVKKSTVTIQEEGLYPNILNFKLFQLDNFTDVMMLNIAISANSKKPFHASMVNDYWRSENFLKLAYDTEQVANNSTEGLYKSSYGRYWQGYLIFLRPALVFFDYSQIRIIHFILLGILLFLASFFIYKKISFKVMAIFLFSMIAINFPIVPLSMQFSTVFYIMLIAIIVILKHKKLFEKYDMFLVLFFIIGACTSFLDFLTAPLITLGIPLIVYILSNEQKSLNKIKTVVAGSFIWGMGYGLMWSSKWVIGGLITNVNILESAMESSVKRTSNIYRGMEMTIPNILKFIQKSIVDNNLISLFWIGLVLFGILVLLYFVLLDKKGSVIKNNIYLLLIALMVPAWYLVLRNHSIQHGWFTWRALIVTIFAGVLFILNTTSINKLNIKSKSLKIEKDEK